VRCGLPGRDDRSIWNKNEAGAQETSTPAPGAYDQEDRLMLESRSAGRRPSSRKYRPPLEFRLEDRTVLNATASIAMVNYLLTHTSPRPAKLLGKPPFIASSAHKFTHTYTRLTKASVQTARGGQAAIVKAKDGTRYRIQLGYTSNTLATSTVTSGSDGSQLIAPTYGSSTGTPSTSTTNYPQPAGTVRVYPMAGGRVGIIVDGSTANTELTISQLPNQQVKGQAHSFAYGESYRGHILNVGQITVNSGSIGSILGFHTTSLSGPITVAGTNPVDRIALDSIQSGGSIQVGGDLNTLDIYNGANLDTGPGIVIGRDLNLMNIGGDITLSNGANVLIGRDTGLTLQPPKGTGTGSNVLALNNINTTTSTSTTATLPNNVSAYILGNIVINPDSQFVIGRYNDQEFYVGGSIVGASRFSPGGTSPTGNGSFVIVGGANP
jgi:hypothetical protein